MRQFSSNDSVSDEECNLNVNGKVSINNTTTDHIIYLINFLADLRPILKSVDDECSLSAVASTLVIAAIVQSSVFSSLLEQYWQMVENHTYISQL